MADQRPEVLFFVATRAQLDDALAVAQHLRLRASVVPVWSESAAAIKLRPPENLRVETLGLAPPLPSRLQKTVGLWRGKLLVSRLTGRERNPVFVFGDDVNTVQAGLIRHILRRNANSLLIQDGLLYEHSVDELVPNPSRISRLGIRVLRHTGLLPPLLRYGMGECRHLAVYSQSTADILERLGVARERLHITGAPRFDNLFRLAAKPQNNVRPQVLYLGLMLHPIGCGTPEMDQHWLSTVPQLAAANPDWDVVLRPHPSEPLEIYKSGLGQYAMPNFRIDREAPIVPAIEASNIVVMHFPSTVLFEAVVLDRPVVFFDLNVSFKRADFLNEEAVLHASEPQKLVSLLQTVMTDSRQRARLKELRKAFILRHLGFDDGLSARRVAGLIQVIYA